MYKVLIADDEEFIIKSLTKGTNWGQYGFQVVSSAKEGMEAFEKICKVRPHIVFTDIRMPGMNGLELIKNIQKVYPDVLFVVISGYAEFAYAQKAIDYGAIGYCLKPFDDYVIDNILKKAKNILDKTKDEDECNVLSLFEEESQEANLELDKFFKSKGLQVDNGIMVLASIGSKKIQFRDDLNCISISAGVNKFIYILEKSDIVEGELFHEGKLPDGIKGIGVCEGIYSADNMNRYIDEAFTSAYQFFVTGSRNIYKNISVNNDDIEELNIKFENAVIKMDINESMNILDTIKEYCQDGVITIKHVMNIYNTYAKCALRILGDTSFDEYVYSFEELQHMFKDANAMVEYIKDKLTRVVAHKTHAFICDVKNEYFKKIINYINQNFYKDISIQSLAQDFTINPNYISQLFRKEVGMTFTDYITSLRINYAKELLENNEYSQSEVAIKCGYSDYFYFIRVFKKITGITPGQFRNMDEDMKEEGMD